MENWEDFTETKNVTINPAKLNGIDYDYAGRGIVEHFENKPKRHKIKMRKVLENEIDEERKRVTLNTFAIGASALATVVFALSVTNFITLSAKSSAGEFLPYSVTSFPSASIALCHVEFGSAVTKP